MTSSTCPIRPGIIDPLNLPLPIQQHLQLPLRLLRLQHRIDHRQRHGVFGRPEYLNPNTQSY